MKRIIINKNKQPTNNLAYHIKKCLTCFITIICKGSCVKKMWKTIFWYIFVDE
jgi:radical SAM protein with 4Fe4S-binding SPASM domain